MMPEVRECPVCEGRGWYEGTDSGHHPNCDCGEGGYLCPIPVQIQIECEMCYGSGKNLEDVDDGH